MSRALSVSVFAPAKVNLALHVIGKRIDGYHLLDSLVAFADVGDELCIRTGNTLSLTTEGPEVSAMPAEMDNLVLKVAALFEKVPDTSFLLTKNLPVSSGIGGGSADAAAAFRGLVTISNDGETSPELFDPAQAPMTKRLLGLGADIPMCLLSQIARVSGIGEEIKPLDGVPSLHAVLVNPRCAVSTPSVFRALLHAKNEAMPDIPRFAGSDDLILWLAAQRNDLEAAAIRVEPAIDIVKTELLASQGCRLARMSGSGATCFGLYETAEAARTAARSIAERYSNWWVRATVLGTQMQRALPRIS